MILEKASLPTQGSAGLRLGRGGAVSNIMYSSQFDGRIMFALQGWMNFLKGKNFVIEQAVMIILRTTIFNNIEMMIEMHII